MKKKKIRYYIVLERAQGPTLLDCNYADTCFTAARGSVLAGGYTQVPHRSTLYQHITGPIGRGLVFSHGDITGPNCRGLVSRTGTLQAQIPSTTSDGLVPSASDPSLEYSTDNVVLFWQTRPIFRSGRLRRLSSTACHIFAQSSL